MNAFQMSYAPVSDPRDVYHNVVIALDRASDTNNGQPGALARWIDALEFKPGGSVYHLGCGAGYYTQVGIYSCVSGRDQLREPQIRHEVCLSSVAPSAAAVGMAG